MIVRDRRPACLAFFHPGDGLPRAQTYSPVHLFFLIRRHFIDEDVAQVVVAQFEDVGRGLLAPPVPLAPVGIHLDLHRALLAFLARVYPPDSRSRALPGSLLLARQRTREP